MKKIASLFLTLLFFGTISQAACVSPKDNNPIPFPFNVELFLKHQGEWLFSENNEVAIQYFRVEPGYMMYALYNRNTNSETRGQLSRYKNQLCDLHSTTPFCLTSEKYGLKMIYRAGNECVETGLGIFSFTYLQD